jgi:hypothetical protein
VTSAFYHVFRLYRQAAGGAYIPVTVTGAPTFNSVAFQFTNPHALVPSLDAVAVRAASSANRVYLYVVNRDLALAIPAQVTIQGLALPVSSLSAQTVNAANIRDKNSAASPAVIQVQTQTLPPTGVFAFTFPAHSVTCFTADAVPPTPTPEPTAQPTIQPTPLPAGLVVFPNPFRPGAQRAVSFSHLAPGGKLNLYNSAGELIFSTLADGQGNVVWDGLGKGGRRVGTGIYFILAEGPGGKVKRKLAVQP